MNPYRLRAYIYLLIVAVIWGVAGPVIKFTLEGIDPLPFLAYRFAIAAVISIIFFAIKLKRGKKFKNLRAHLPLAILYGILAVPVGLGILFIALDRTTVLDLTLVGVMGPMIATAGSAYFFHDHITRREKAGITIVLLGVIFNSFIPLFKSGSDIRLTGNILLIIYLLADAGSVLMAKKALRYKIKSANLTNLAFIVGAVTVIPLAILTYTPGNLLDIVVNLPLKYHLGVWYMAIASGSIAYFLYVRAQRSIEASEASLFMYLQPIFTVPLAVLWLGESLSSTFMLGAAIIAIGLFVAESKKKREAKKPKPVKMLQ